MRSGEDQGRDVRVLDAFVDLADSLVEDYDPLDFLYRLLEHSIPLVGASAAGVLLLYEGRLHLVASSNEGSELVELLELQHAQGPAHDAFHSGEAQLTDLVSEAADRWPEFAAAAMPLDWTTSFAVPLRLRDVIVGAFVVFWSNGIDGPDDDDAKLLRGFADVATIAVLQRRALSEVERVNDQLHGALESRIHIEQAKGMLAQATGMEMGDTFETLRRHARSHGRRLVDVARDIIAGKLGANDLTSG